MNIRAPYEETYNYYGDESCHLFGNANKYMALGALCCLKNSSKNLSMQIRKIKLEHGLSRDFEIKNTKVSMGAIDFYSDLIKWFFNCTDLYFRVVLIDKSLIKFDSSDEYNLFYYKMYYILFRYYMHGMDNHIYLDYKDSRSYLRCAEIQNFLGNDHITNMKKITVQQIDSKESNLMQIADLLTGLVCYNANGKMANKAKRQLVDALKKGTGLDLFQTTTNATKFDILNWRPKNEYRV